MENASLELNEHYRNVLMPNTVFLFLEIILGIAGNSLVLIVYKFKMKNTNEDRYFIPVLAVLDIFAGTVSSSFYISDSLYWVAYPSAGLCKFFFFMTTYSSGPSAHILFLIALQRYLKICRPTGKQMSLLWKRISIGLVLVLSCMYAAPLLHYSDLQEVSWVFKGQNVTGTMCIMAANATGNTDFYYFATLLFIVIANVIVTSGLYVPIGLVIYRRNASKKRQKLQLNAAKREVHIDEPTKSTGNSEDHSGNAAPDKSSKENAKQIRDRQLQTNFNQMFFAIVVLYALSFLPTFALIFIVRVIDNFWISLTDAELGVYVFISRTIVFNHIFNPLIYGYYDVRFRSEIKTLCGHFMGRKRKRQVHQVT